MLVACEPACRLAHRLVVGERWRLLHGNWHDGGHGGWSEEEEEWE